MEESQMKSTWYVLERYCSTGTDGQEATGLLLSPTGTNRTV